VRSNRTASANSQKNRIRATSQCSHTDPSERPLPKVIRWKRQWGGSDIVVWVIRKVDDAWRSDPIPGYYVPRGKCVRHRFGDWLRKYSDSEKAWMPHLGYIGYKHCTDGPTSLRMVQGPRRQSDARHRGNQKASEDAERAEEQMTDLEAARAFAAAPRHLRYFEQAARDDRVGVRHGAVRCVACRLGFRAVIGGLAIPPIRFRPAAKAGLDWAPAKQAIG
jgi:hypothetical protein